MTRTRVPLTRLPHRLCSAYLVLSLLGIAVAASAQVTAPALGSGVPIPPAERALTTIVADRPIRVPGATLDLEGPVFLPGGDLLFSDVQGKRVMRLDRHDRLTTVVTLPGLMPGGMALAPDGRIFIAAANGKGGGAIIAMRVDGSRQQTILPEAGGFAPNDIAFDAKGGFYFTDARGTVGEFTGGVWYVASAGAPPGPGRPASRNSQRHRLEPRWNAAVDR